MGSEMCIRDSNKVSSVRQGKVIDLELNESSKEAAIDSIKEMCEKLLANTVIENYEIELL